MKLDDMTFTGGAEITLRKTEVERTSVLSKLTGIYDEHAKLVFLFDVSGSMTERVAATYTEQYVWTPDVLTGIRTAVTNALAKLADPMALIMGLGDGETETLKLVDPNMQPGAFPTFTANDEELKARVLKMDLIGHFGLRIDFTKPHTEPPRRIDLVKKLAKSELENRFKKYPGSKVAVIPFGDQPIVMFDDGTPDKLWPALDCLKKSYSQDGMCCGGGTDILMAIRKALDVCRDKPSPVGIHHFIVVSDGEDHMADSTIGTWVPALKASGVVLDYIHIGCDSSNAGLKAACIALGGECVSVNSENDFQKKFIEVVNRLMLPPAPTV